MGRFENMISMLPSQFRNKPFVEAYIHALGKQLDEVEKMFWELDNLTDADTAEGEQLDRIGDIVVLSRKEAALLIDDAASIIMDDDTYRRFLKYKILKNTNRCTYDDLMDGLELVWNTDRLQYMEDESYPATIIFSTGVISLDDEDIRLNRKLCIKASGILLLLKKIFHDYFEVEIKIDTGLVIGCDVYARNNRVPLFLDGSWSLDGIFGLHGYKDDNQFDFHPITLSIGCDIDVENQIETGVSLSIAIGAKPEHDTSIIIGSQVAMDNLNENGIEIATAIRASPEINCGLTVEKDLWYLDGSWSLNGTKLLDAEIIKYNNI